jgi:DNA invertase Pin-like site-specific DNA recombinase
MDVIYLRASTAEQEPEIQLPSVLTLLTKEKYELFIEKDTAWVENVKRPEFEKILNLIKKGKVTDLYVFDLDRLYRNYKKLKEFFTLCKVYNTKVHSFNQVWLEDINKIPFPFNEIVFEMLISFFGWIGEQESEKKGNRVRNAVVKAKNGTFSYKGNKWGRKGFPKQTETRVLELHTKGVSIRKIAEQVFVYDKNNNGRKISKSAVHKIVAQKSSEKDSF